MKKRLHEEIYGELRQEILSKRKPGECLPSEAELAKRFGVSVVTLRNATLGLEADGFVNRVSGIGVLVCDRKAHGRLALVSRDVAFDPRPLYFHLRFTPLLQRNLLQAGWKTVTHLQMDSDPGSLDDLRDGMARGRYTAVVWTIGDVPKDIRAHAAKHSVTVLGGTDCHLVKVDYDAMIKEGVDHLVRSGCRRIAGLFSGPPTEFPEPDDRHASRVFNERLAHHGLSAPPGLVVQDTEARLTGSGWQGFRDLWSASRERPDGLLVLDDVLYHDAARAILELGIQVPSRLRIVTHSNRGDDFVHPFPVSLLEVDPEEMAAAAAEFVMQTLEGGGARPQDLPVRLIPAQQKNASIASATAPV
ncbi:MAG: substrate-binding domain-containing protein [Verrucomicrobia bacterium]|nr:substrate-binding domain-containing protein [Verrucomicrobiota bacterium]